MSKFSNTKLPVTVGIVGLGRAGWSLHFEPISKLPGFKIVAVADPLADRCREATELVGCAQFSTVDELLAGSDAQLVVIATPSLTHYEDTHKVLRAGRHCIIEKPLAMRSSEADELVAMAREKELGLFVHHIHLHLPPFYLLRAAIDGGLLGKLFAIHVCWGNYARRWDWQTLRKNGGGQLFNTCPHLLSIVLPLLGSPVKEVFADLRNIKDAGDAEDHAHILIRTESGLTADLVASSAMALSGPRYVLCGTSGAMISDGHTGKLRHINPTEIEPVEIIDAAAPGRQYLKESLPWQEKDIEAELAPVKAFHENILDVFSGSAEPVVTPESAAEVVRVINMIQAAARSSPYSG